MGLPTLDIALPWADWEPVYAAIRADFGYGLAADVAARDLFLEQEEPWCAPTELPDLAGQTVAVVGGAAPTERDTKRISAADACLGAGVGGETVREADAELTVYVTDLDTPGQLPHELTQSGIPVAVHGHGDNHDALTTVLPTLETSWVLPTTQAEPRGPVVNCGGFTDGDRAAFLAHALGAARLVFPSWAFDDPAVSKTKRRKLAWAERLLYWLERHRDERFAVLDGRRDDIDSLPTETNQNLR